MHSRAVSHLRWNAAETTKRTVFIYHSRLESPNVAVAFATCSLYSYFSRISYDHVGVGEVLHKAEEL